MSDLVPLERHLDGLSAAELAVWERYRQLVEACGPSEMVITKSRIAFRAHRIFTGGFFSSGRFELFFDLPRPVPDDRRDERFRAVWEQAKKLWVHRLKIEKPSDLGRGLPGWLRVSWATYSKPAGKR